MLKNIIFDFGNVLFDLDEYQTEQWLRQTLDPEKSWDVMEKVLHPFERGEISEEAFFNRLQRRSRIVLDGALYYEAWNSMLIGMPQHRFSMLGELRKKFRLYLLSNINITHLRALKRKIKSQDGIVDFEDIYFDKVYYSFQIGFRKPEHSCFTFVLNDAGISADQTLFIDDREDNISAAQNLGFMVYRHNPQMDIADVLPDLLNKYGECISAGKI